MRRALLHAHDAGCTCGLHMRALHMRALHMRCCTHTRCGLHAHTMRAAQAARATAPSAFPARRPYTDDRQLVELAIQHLAQCQQQLESLTGNFGAPEGFLDGR